LSGSVAIATRTVPPEDGLFVPPSADAWDCGVSDEPETGLADGVFVPHPETITVDKVKANKPLLMFIFQVIFNHAPFGIVR